MQQAHRPALTTAQTLFPLSALVKECCRFQSLGERMCPVRYCVYVYVTVSCSFRALSSDKRWVAQFLYVRCESQHSTPKTRRKSIKHKISNITLHSICFCYLILKKVIFTIKLFRDDHQAIIKIHFLPILWQALPTKPPAMVNAKKCFMLKKNTIIKCTIN